MLTDIWEKSDWKPKSNSIKISIPIREQFLLENKTELLTVPAWVKTDILGQTPHNCVYTTFARWHMTEMRRDSWLAGVRNGGEGDHGKRTSEVCAEVVCGVAPWINAWQMAHPTHTNLLVLILNCIDRSQNHEEKVYEAYMGHLLATSSQPILVSK